MYSSTGKSSVTIAIWEKNRFADLYAKAMPPIEDRAAPLPVFPGLYFPERVSGQSCDTQEEDRADHQSAGEQ
jgi:hypothetical protein